MKRHETATRAFELSVNLDSTLVSTTLTKNSTDFQTPKVHFAVARDVGVHVNLRDELDLGRHGRVVATRGEKRDAAIRSPRECWRVLSLEALSLSLRTRPLLLARARARAIHAVKLAGRS